MYITRETPYMHTYVMLHGAAVYTIIVRMRACAVVLFRRRHEPTKPGRALVFLETILIHNASRRLLVATPPRRERPVDFGARRRGLLRRPRRDATAQFSVAPPKKSSFNF